MKNTLQQGADGKRSDSSFSSSTPVYAEKSYNLLTLLGFARRYVSGKNVIFISREGIGVGSSLLSETAKSVVGLTDSEEELGVASRFYPAAPNVRYERAGFPELPHPEGYFDVAVVWSMVERLVSPENLLREVKRVLGRDGLLIVSTPDKQAHSNDRNYKDPEHIREMYVPEFEELVERFFKHVSLYRHGAVSGGIVFKTPANLSRPLVETAGFDSISKPSPEGVDTCFVLAVCSDDMDAMPGDERPYLLLDCNRRIFDESDDQREDIELLKAEIDQMQRTEVQAFQDALLIRNSENQHLNSENQRLKAEIRRLENRNANLEQHIRNIESSHTWQALRLYRGLRARLGARKQG